MVPAISATPVALLQWQMEEGVWDRAVELAQGGESAGEVQTLSLDGVVKCAQGKLPKPKVFAPFTQLKRLSIANVGLSSLADFPSLPHLEWLILGDNRIAGGLEHLVYAGLTSLRELDLSNNKIQAVEDLKPLAQFKLESLDLYECTVTRSVDYRAKVFGMMRSLRFLDKMDVTGNERPESDEEEEEDLDDLNGDDLDVEGAEGDSEGVALHDVDEEGENIEERDDKGEDNEELEDEDEDEGGSFQEEVMAVSGRRVVQGHVNNNRRSNEEDDNVEVLDCEESVEEEVGEEDEDAAVEEDEDDEEGTLTEPVNDAHVSTDCELDVQENEDGYEDENGELGEDEEDDEVEDNDVGEGVVEEEVFTCRYLLNRFLLN
jgi:hypothetical protein